MIFGFRVDASIQIGSGHVIRCLTIADALKQKGHTCVFICREHVGHLMDLIHMHGHTIYELNPFKLDSQEYLTEYQKWLGTTEEIDAQQTLVALGHEAIQLDWMVVDHYALSEVWETRIRTMIAKILVIDDLANRKHDADLLLDCGLEYTVNDYQLLNARSAKYLLGAEYALLRPEFSEHRKNQPIRYQKEKEIFKVLINLGGVDKDNLTSKILKIFEEDTLFKHRFDLTIVMGISAPWKEQIIQQAELLPYPSKVLVNVSNMAELMKTHDFAIGAAGSTAWERCCLGLPTIMICMAENQKMIAQNLNNLGAAISIDQQEVEQGLGKILSSLTLSKLEIMSEKARLITQGHGVELLLNQIFAKSQMHVE
ncbi:UDP-2,4-diacetamido-2,4,6-trideoxy-beta-L-altropyranose hydrolase [Acinetobacter terrestris]|uniref:UDP-2,4-diacetamido-2,4, 6-trideoxy-beta-L-altropyranose hydrolase n=1 Tax=Acinetobacter terrestris TaxID=2529843 RepID=UPI00103F20CD|nr:UDP-2,4-diacetamido-2,4,6-trideoxy-beta-L-altropyranose hydrolase [Acinetobacter terrestris]TCB52214.1 UDP-2,4-diacetamido-2,4,6-trideoxy-beta-L-altropyranose hydrolase [Acinetobacter terrestris]